MTLTDGQLDWMRSTVERHAPDRCTVTRPGGPGTLDPETATYSTSDAEEAVYEGPCTIRPLPERSVDFGERMVTVARWAVTLPHDADGIRDGDHFTVAASTDADLVEQLLVVVDVQGGSNHIARRLVVESHSGKSEGVPPS